MSKVLIVGATQGTGRELAAEYVRRGADVTITGRDLERAEKAAAELGPKVTGLAFDLSRPHEIAAGLESLTEVDRVVLIGMARDANSLKKYDVAKAIELATTKIVGYTTVVSTLSTRMTSDASVLIFGGVAKDYPYPGSTTLTAVNAAVEGLVRTLSVEMAPIRVNSIHPAVIEDTPFWAGREAMVAPVRDATLSGRLGVMRDIVEGCLFLLENPMANGVDLRLDGGRA
jgi:NAD(P)-dependent dehydrogenase (short-subunit alcohol dehydrogenase family)